MAASGTASTELRRDDYPKAEFEVEIEVKRVAGSTAVEVYADFELSEPSLLRLVEDDKAQYGLLVKVPKTHDRRLLRSRKRNIREGFSAGELSGRVEFLPFLVCTQLLVRFRSDGWHTDFTERSSTSLPVQFLPRTCQETTGSIRQMKRHSDRYLDTRRRSDLPDGRWVYELAEDRVWIVMSNADAAKYEGARERVNQSARRPVPHERFVLACIGSGIERVDRNASDYSSYRWFASLTTAWKTLGSTSWQREFHRLIDAQKLLDSPFSRMPLIATAGIGG